ncbi:MAG: hypothetical protein Pg6B_05570 [Candidatus Azobacteroides pseudotrichonymphae]|nr:MAG: hypothetical protein Pg6B_05570 [Candidatus Azobacteroides pseudotrichonymphae]
MYKSGLYVANLIASNILARCTKNLLIRIIAIKAIEILLTLHR